MIRSTQGLVLHTTKYSETSLIAKVFTRELGVRSYIIKGVRSATGRHKQNLLQPLTHLDMAVYDNPKKNLQYIKEMRPARHYNAIAGDSVRMALVFFMDEVLYKALKEEEPNEALFDYVVSELETLSQSDENAATPIRFMLRTADLLGIAPMDNYSIHEPLFNLKEGRFQAPMSATAQLTNPNAAYFLDAPSSTHLHYYLDGARNSRPAPMLSAAQRRDTLNHLLEYYEVHLAEFHNFKSAEVLHAVLR